MRLSSEYENEVSALPLNNLQYYNFAKILMRNLSYSHYSMKYKDFEGRYDKDALFFGLEEMPDAVMEKIMQL